MSIWTGQRAKRFTLYTKDIMKQSISKLTDKEHHWIAEQIAGATMFVEAFSPPDARQPLTLAALDRAFAAWINTRDSENQTINAAINSVGITFGQFLVDGVGLTWVIATDESGSDLAVYGKVGDILIYPANFVAKRWERRETNFLETSYATIVQQVRAIGQHHKASVAAKPWWKFW
jgi:hypothetical protein